MGNFNDVLDFWFKELSPKKWFSKDEKLDAEISRKFSTLHAHAARAELFSWRENSRGRLAEIIVLDQFSRNMFRGRPLAFAFDAQALILSQEAVRSQADASLATIEKSFLYMPFMHSESLEIHNVAMKLFNQPGLESGFEYEKMHFEIIRRFGRYPHRNETLNRKSTPEEIDFLRTNPGF